MIILAAGSLPAGVVDPMTEAETDARTSGSVLDDATPSFLEIGRVAEDALGAEVVVA